MAIDSRKPYKREFKNFLITPKFQIKFISYFVGLFFICSASLYSVSYLFFWKLKDKALSVGIPEGHVFFHFINGQKADLDWLFLMLTIVNFILLVGAGIIISHRVAGPLYKVNKFLSSDNLKNEEFFLRKNDFFKELVPVINNLREKMK